MNRKPVILPRVWYMNICSQSRPFVLSLPGNSHQPIVLVSLNDSFKGIVVPFSQNKFNDFGSPIGIVRPYSSIILNVADLPWLY